jgi:prolyl-tRNA editing enzyme YbaK/EbsC (Cys-tRNA(Pro) deacylase)
VQHFIGPEGYLVLKMDSESVQKVVAVLHAAGHAQPPRWLDAAARTAQQAADALGVGLGQIAKSVIFRRTNENAAASDDATTSGDAAVLVVTAGDRRVDVAKVQALVCQGAELLGRADAHFVKSKTGFAIGGVAPVGHATALVTLIDRSLFRFDSVWAAAGHPHAVFEITPAALQALCAAPVADVTETVST